MTHAWENERYTKWKTFHEDTAPKQDILQMDDAQNGETPKTRLNIQDKKYCKKECPNDNSRLFTTHNGNKNAIKKQKLIGKNKCPNGNFRLFTKHNGNNNANKNTHRWRRKTQPASKTYTFSCSIMEKFSRRNCMENLKTF